ncbi:MAG: hypothetical protein AAF126_10095, partial [Chloroflexota bacterium]
GVRNSQKRLKELIRDFAIEPIKAHQEDLLHKLSLVEQIVTRRVAKVILHWLEHKAEPVKPESSDMMSSITNLRRNDMTLNAFYIEEVKSGIHELAPLLGLEVPVPYEIETDELEYALIELEDRFAQKGDVEEAGSDDSYSVNYAAYDDYDTDDYRYDDTNGSRGGYDGYEMASIMEANNRQPQRGRTATMVEERVEPAATLSEVVSEQTPQAKSEQSIVVQQSRQQVEQAPTQQVDVNVINLSSERAWQLTYDLIGFNTEYVQGQMLPRWVQNPETFEKDRRFLYQTFLDTIRNAAGSQMIAGNYRFSDRPMTIDELWQYYHTDLSRNVGPMLSAAKLEAAVNDPWYRRWWKTSIAELRKISPVWLLALAIALVFDGLTTYVSLDQTPMDGFMVLVFTALITALFQIADVMVINYRKREFEADAMVAKYNAQHERFKQTISSLETTSESYVQMSMKRSQALADWKAAEDNRKMAKRGRFWSARIADINVIVTAYGFAFMFLNAEEPMYALFEQVQIINAGAWEQFNLWVFLMIGLAVTVSFVINTAQRTEVLGWSMRRLKNEPA